MSRAFVKEEDPDSPVVLPDRPISEHPNYVTQAGLAEIESRIETLSEELTLVTEDQDIASRTRRAEIQRDLRYYRQRLDSAELIEPGDNLRVRFGHAVCFEDEAGEEHRFRIVGEDEASPSEGKVFFASPVASMLIGRSVGDVTRWQRGDRSVEIEITHIE